MTYNNKEFLNNFLMHIKCFSTKVIFCLSLLLVTVPESAYSNDDMAIPAPPTGTRQYHIYWVKSLVGSIDMAITQEGNSYTLSSRLKAHGLSRKLFKFWMNTYSTANYIPNQLIHPDIFNVEYRLRKTYRTIDLDFDSVNDTLLSEAVNPPDNRHKRPEVPDILKYQTIDPHTAILRIHQEIHLALRHGYNRFSVPIYDGRRRANLYVTIIGKKQIDVRGIPIQVVHIQLQRDVLSGATVNELKRGKKEEPIIDLFLEDNDGLIPVKAIARAPIGNVVAVMVR